MGLEYRVEARRQGDSTLVEWARPGALLRSAKDASPHLSPRWMAGCEMERDLTLRWAAARLFFLSLPRIRPVAISRSFPRNSHGQRDRVTILV